MFAYRPTIKRGEVIASLKGLKRLVRKLEGLHEWSFDTETNTLKVNADNEEFKLVGISISWGAYHNYYIPTGHVRWEDCERQLDVDTVSKYLKKVFENRDIRLVGANIKFDMHVMKRIGIQINTKDLYDVVIMSYLCDENYPNGLKENTVRYLRIPQTHFGDVLKTIPKEVKKDFGLKSNSKGTIDLALIEEAAPYAMDDAFYTWELYKGFLFLIEDEGMEKIYNVCYKQFIHTIFNMEEKGVAIDYDKLKEMQKDIEKDIEQLKYKMVSLCGVKINFGSSQQLGMLLFGYNPYFNGSFDDYLEELRQSNSPEYFDSKKVHSNYENERSKYKEAQAFIDKYSFHFRAISTTGKGAPSTSSDVLWSLSNLTFKTKKKKDGVELVKLLMEVKKLEKLKSAFIDGMLEQIYDDRKAHPSFNITGTVTGRLSCSKPNLQQLPKADEDDKYQIRSVFIGSIDEVTGKRKKIIACDFSNLEMRVLAHFSKDENLLHMFATGADTHGATAVNMFELDCDPSEVKKKYPHLRQAAKILNFLLMYGGGATLLYNNLKGDHYSPIDLGAEEYLKAYGVRTGVEVAQCYIDRYFKTYKGVANFIRNQKRFAHKHGFVYTLLKRKRRLPEINSRDMAKVSFSERSSVNSPIQGSAAELTMCAQNRVALDSWFAKHRAYMLVQVHDEIVMECPEEYAQECMERVQAFMSHPFGDNIELNLEMKADGDIGDSYAEAK